MVKEEKHYYVYIIKCADDTLYTGMTNDIDKRLEAHSKGKGAKYTRGRGPFSLVYAKKYRTKSAALKAEMFIKSLSRRKKEEWIEKEKG